MTQIIPAILTKNIEDFDHKMTAIHGLSAWVQVDIMDGVFVPNTSVDISVADPYKNDVSVEAHLMVHNPLEYVAPCKEFGVKRVIFHFESTQDAVSVANAITEAGMEAGIAINPETKVVDIANVIPHIKRVLFLGVHPGFQKQTFLPDTLYKIRELKVLFPEMIAAVDGGVNQETIESIVAAGADSLIIGSALFETDDIKKNLEYLQDLAQPK